MSCSLRKLRLDLYSLDLSPHPTGNRFRQRRFSASSSRNVQAFSSNRGAGLFSIPLRRPMPQCSDCILSREY